MTAATQPAQRERILDTALDLMAEHGASATSMRKLANACNLNVAALYHYFPSKAELLRSVIEERRYALRMRDLPDVDPALPPRERLVALILEVWQGVRDEEAIWRLLLGEALRGDETAVAVGHELLATLEPGLRAWLEQLFTDADFDTDAVATVLLAQLFSFFVSQLFRPPDRRDASARREAEALVALALPGQ